MSHYFVRCGEGESFAFLDQVANVLARPETTRGELSAAIITGSKGVGFPLHRHAASHECFVVMGGILELQVGEKVVRLATGDFASVPAGTPHGYTMRSHRGFSACASGDDSRVPAGCGA